MGDREESLHNWSLKSVSWNFDEFLLDKELKYGNASWTGLQTVGVYFDYGDISLLLQFYHSFPGI